MSFEPHSSFLCVTDPWFTVGGPVAQEGLAAFPQSGLVSEKVDLNPVLVASKEDAAGSGFSAAVVPRKSPQKAKTHVVWEEEGGSGG